MDRKSRVYSVLRWTAGALGIVTGAYASYVGVTWLRYGHPAPASPDDADPLLDRFMAQPPSANMSVQQITAAIVKSLESGDTNMKQSREIQAITVNGVAGGSVELQTLSPLADADGKTQPERDWLVTVPRSGNAIMIVFVATQKYFEQMRPTFEKMLRSVQFR